MGYEIDFLPVGEESKSGDAITFRFGNLHGGRHEQTVVVVDGGFVDTGDDIAAHLYDHYETQHVDVMVSTHPDDDHIRGLISMLENDAVTVGELWLHKPWEHNEAARVTKAYASRERAEEGSFEAYIANAERLHDLAVTAGVPVVEPFAGHRRSSHGYTLTVVGPTAAAYADLVGDFGARSTAAAHAGVFKAAAALLSRVAESLFTETLTDAGSTSAANDSSAMLLLSDGSRGCLLTGDAGIPALESAAEVIERFGLAEALRFVQVPHHGSRRNVGPTVLDRLLGPKGATDRGTAFCSAAKKGAPKHPAKMVTNAFARRGFPVHLTAGRKKWHHRDAPDRAGWSQSVPEPFHNEVEDFND